MISRLIASLMLAVAMLAAPAASRAEVAVGVVVSFGPPALPIYAQPLCPGPSYIWVPGYWAWDPAFGYFWVPGAWVFAPFPGALWTPGYWAYEDDGYVFYDGYWGPVVGWYGGINYGFGYTGYGYYGGYWQGSRFYYNRAVNNINTTNITNVYNTTVINNNVTHVSYNGGPGGVRARPNAEQQAAAMQKRSGPISAQRQQFQLARGDSGQRASENKGRPQIAATRMPGEFSGRGIVRASRAGAPYKPAPMQSPRGRTFERPEASPGPHPGRSEPSPRMNAPEPRRAQPQPRMERPAPERREPPQPQYRREPPPETRQAPNVDRQPMDRQPMGRPQMERRPVERQPAPQAQGPGRGRQEQSRPPQSHGGGNPHKPDKPHDHE